MELTLLDVCCGMGGVSDGFAAEGFTITGIDIVNAPRKLNYSYKFIQADLRELSGENYRGKTVIWVSPPCRDFSKIGIVVGHKWKIPPNPEHGLELVIAAQRFIEEAQPKYWVLENVDRLQKFYNEKPKFVASIGRSMYRAFWGNFPAFLMPRTDKILTARATSGFITHFKGERQIASWARAKIPFPCSQAFARAIKEALSKT
jgi:hypothetical protein